MASSQSSIPSIPTSGAAAVSLKMGGHLLAQELWDMIVLACKPRDWKNLRLTCKAFEKQATQLRFEEVRVWFKTPSLQRLISIADNQNLSKHVHTLLLNATTVPLFRGQGEIMNSIHVVLRTGLPLLQHFKLYNTYNDPFHVSDTLSAITTNHLKSIDLECCVYEADSFLAFLEKHSKTLQDIEMDRSLLFGGQVRTIFDFMRNKMQITRFELSSYLVELKHQYTFYATLEDSPADELTPESQRKARAVISEYITKKSDEHKTHLFDEDPAAATFDESEIEDAIEVIAMAGLGDSDDLHWGLWASKEADYELDYQDQLERAMSDDWDRDDFDDY